MSCAADSDSSYSDDSADRIVVIGYGSPIRGDDAVGPIVADRVRERLSAAHVNVISRHVLTAELAAELQHAARVIFIDALPAGEPGTVSVRPLEPCSDHVGVMAHTLDAPGLLAWVEGLYGRAPEAYLVATVGARFDYANCQLSPVVQQAVASMIDHIVVLCQSPIRERKSPETSPVGGNPTPVSRTGRS